MNDVTVVIPTLMDASGLLKPCLASLQKHAPGVPFSICGVLARRTFAENCNKGARWVSSPYVLFLNDDTEVHAGFLEPLVKVLNDNDTVIAVGSKLVYPDGRIQHAGVYFTVHPATGRVDGHNRLANQPAGYVAAVTGAAMLVRREPFLQLGGFDEAYRNGNEDVDFCLKAQHAGWRIFYEPASVITHHESASGPERWAHVGENIALLTHRWAHRLGAQ